MRNFGIAVYTRNKTTKIIDIDYLRVEHISVNRLVVVVFVLVLMKRCQSLLQDFINGGLSSTSWTNTHQAMTNQLCLIQLDDFTHLCSTSIKEKLSQLRECVYLRLNQLEIVGKDCLFNVGLKDSIIVFRQGYTREKIRQNSLIKHKLILVPFFAYDINCQSLQRYLITTCMRICTAQILVS